MEKEKNIVKKQSIKDNIVDKNQQQQNTQQDKLPNKEFGGRKGLEPTRYGDWEKNGRCIDF